MGRKSKTQPQLRRKPGAKNRWNQAARPGKGYIRWPSRNFVKWMRGGKLIGPKSL